MMDRIWATRMTRTMDIADIMAEGDAMLEAEAKLKRQKSPDQIECEAWEAEWLANNPPPKMSKKERWRVAHAAWLEWRRQVRRAEGGRATRHL
jgi:hypothetical protein